MWSFVKKYFNKPKTPLALFQLVFVVSAIIRVVYILIPTRPWWDATVYLGMARFLGSSGAVGIWEPLRPVLLPIILSPFSWISPQYFEVGAKIIITLFALVTLILVYKIGEKLKSYAGVVAALLLSFSTPFFAYSNVPMTEVLSVFWVVCVMYFFIEKMWIPTGLALGFAFLTRFPLGLLILIVGTLLVFKYSIDSEYSFKEFLKNTGEIIIGGIIPLVFFLSFNSVVYQDFLLPLREGPSTITGYIWLYQQDWFFYIKEIIMHNAWALVIIGFLMGILFQKSKREVLSLDKKLIFGFGVVTIAFFGLYFSLQPHKELRYMIPAMPILAMIAGYAYVMIFEWIRNKKLWWGIVIVSIIFSMIGFRWFITSEHREAYARYYDVLNTKDPQGFLLASAPQFAAFSSVRVYEGYNTWARLADKYERGHEAFDYIAMDSCELRGCTPGNEQQCVLDESNLIKHIEENDQVIYRDTIGTCRVMVAKINH